MEEEMHDELQNISPDFPVRKSPEAPDGYFSTLPDEILNRWKKNESQSLEKKLTWWRVVSIAAMLCGLWLGGWWFFSNTHSPVAREISSLEAYQYIHENIDEFEPILEESNVVVEVQEIDVPQDAVEEYLMEEIHGSNPEDLF